MKLDNALDFLCTKGREAILKVARKDSCIGSCRVGMDTLRRLGIPSTPLAVKVAVFNAKAAEFMAQNKADWVREQRDGAYALGIGYPNEAVELDRWNGHLILLVGEYMVDLSIDQTARPEKGIQIRPFYAKLAEYLSGGLQVLVLNPQGGTILYEPNPGNAEWKGTPDWDGPRWESISKALAQEFKTENQSR